MRILIPAALALAFSTAASGSQSEPAQGSVSTDQTGATGPADADIRAAAQNLLVEGDQKYLGELTQLLRDYDLEDENWADRLDKMILKLTPGSPAWGQLRSTKAEILQQETRFDEAAAVMRDLRERYPNNPGPRFQGVELLTFSPNFEQAAQDWLWLAERFPSLALNTDPYTIDSLLGRLKESWNDDLAARLALGLSSRGYDQGSTEQRASIASQSFLALAASGSDEAASVQLAKISSPDKLRTILVRKDLQRYWPQAQKLSGSGFDIAAPRYFTGLMTDYREDGDIGALAALMRGYRTDESAQIYVDRYLPILQKAMMEEDQEAEELDFDYLFWVSPLAGALSELGRDNDAEQLYRDAQSSTGAINDVFRLNIDANLAVFYVTQSRYQDALPVIDGSIALMERDRSANESALARMHAVRVAALDALGRLDADDPSLQFLEEKKRLYFQPYCDTLALLGRKAELKSFLTESLNGPYFGQSLEYLQPTLSEWSSPIMRRTQAVLEELRTDPEILAAVEPKGRILDYPQLSLEGLNFPEGR